MKNYFTVIAMLVGIVGFSQSGEVSLGTIANESVQWTNADIVGIHPSCTPSRSSQMVAVQQFQEANHKTYDIIRDLLEDLRGKGRITEREYQLIIDNLLHPYRTTQSTFVDPENLDSYGKALAEASLDRSHINDSRRGLTYGTLSAGSITSSDIGTNAIIIRNDELEWIAPPK